MERRSLGSSLLVPCVQELAKEPILEVPPRYVRTDQDTVVPSWVTSTRPEVPIIDMQRLSSQDSADYELERPHLACRDWGFFQLINHGLSDSLLEKLKAETQEFFNLPMDEKKKYWQQAGDIEGFGQAFVVSEEQKLDRADMFYLVTLRHDITRLYPIHWASKMDVEDTKALFEEGMQSMRMNYYPPCPQPEKVIGLSPHLDPLGITFLLQINEVEGLEIKKDGIWMPVKPLPNSLIVNIGDTLDMVTNGLYKSIEHRAIVNSEKERLSIATFFAPKLDVEIRPAPSLMTPENPPNLKG